MKMRREGDSGTGAGGVCVLFTGKASLTLVCKRTFLLLGPGGVQF